MNVPKADAVRGQQLILGAEQRRSQRVMLRVPVILNVVLDNQTTAIHAHTLVVNAHGAMVLCSRLLPAATTLELQHGHTRQRVACRVTRTPRETSDGFQTPLEFESPASGFWQISFPPTDWKPTKSEN